MISVQTRQYGTTSVISVMGKINFEVTSQLREAFRDVMLKDKPSVLLINLDGVDFIDSSGLGLLIAAKNSAGKNDVAIRLCELSPAVLKTFQQTNLIAFFTIFTTEEAALMN